MWAISEQGLHAPPVQLLDRACPHCHAVAHITPVAVPSLAELKARKPRRIGAVFHCDACGAPRFLRFSVRRIDADIVELAGPGQEVERVAERFPFSYLPRPVERLFREALLCHAGECYNAFASMCRRTARAAFADLGETGRLKMYDTLEEIRELVDLDDALHSKLREVLFGTDGDDRLPEFDPDAAAVLLEVIRDLLHQIYVRRRKLERTLKMRRFFARESARHASPRVVGSDTR